MNYIQNKLDTIDIFDYIVFEDGDIDKEKSNEKLKELFTDYHNHIVKIIKRHYPANIESMQLLINRLDCILGVIQNGYVINGELQETNPNE